MRIIKTVFICAIMTLFFTALSFAAGPVTDILRPDGNNNTVWNAYAYTLIDEVVIDPDTGALDGTHVTYDKDDDGENQSWTLSDPADTSWQVADQIEIHAYFLQTNGLSTDAALNIDGFLTSQKTFTSAEGWQTLTWVKGVDFTGYFTRTELANTILHMIAPTVSGGSKECHIDAVYVKVCGLPTVVIQGGSVSGGSWGTS